MRPARRAFSWEQGEWAGQTATGGATRGRPAFGLIAAVPVKAGYTRQARRGRGVARRTR